MWKMGLKEYFPFDNVRPEQVAIFKHIKQAYMEDKRYIIIEAGTGVGKSAIAKTMCGYEGGGYVLTSTKQLQDQYLNDFYNMGARTIKGKSNYTCTMDKDFDCQNGMCFNDPELKKECIVSGNCPYENAKKEAFASNMCVTSYAFFLGYADLMNTMEEDTSTSINKNLIILDECHLLEKQLLSMAEFNLNIEYLNKRFQLSIAPELDYEDKDVVFKHLTSIWAPLQEGYSSNNINFVTSVLFFVNKRLEFYQSMVEKLHDRTQLTAEDLEKIGNEKQLMYDYDALKKLKDNIVNFLEDDNHDNWLITSEGSKKLCIQPLKIGHLFEKLIDKYSNNKIIFMSATILDIETYCEDIGIDIEDVYFCRQDGTFPSNNSPIIIDDIGKINRTTLDEPETLVKICEKIEEILERHPNEKGIIHTANGSLLSKIVEQIPNNRFLYRNETFTTNEQLIQAHEMATRPTVLISPSLTTGVDLHDDLARFQIIVKLPYISLGDKRVMHKKNENLSWYINDMLKTFVQECGRITRHEEDWGITYVLDGSTSYTINRHAKNLPYSFLVRIKLARDFNTDIFLANKRNE